MLIQDVGSGRSRKTVMTKGLYVTDTRRHVSVTLTGNSGTFLLE